MREPGQRCGEGVDPNGWADGDGWRTPLRVKWVMDYVPCCSAPMPPTCIGPNTPSTVNDGTQQEPTLFQSRKQDDS